MPLLPVIMDLLGRASRALGFETIDGFPPGHVHARTRWDRAYFDIASDVKPDQIESAVCEAIANTPLVFGRIVNPTPRMQRTILGIIDARLRGSGGAPADLVRLRDGRSHSRPARGHRRDRAIRDAGARGAPARLPGRHAVSL
jgi:hypothetical protein